MADGTGLSGRQGEARRNDAKILAAARAVFVADPDAPIAAVAERAGVNIASLYRRFASKEEVLRRLCHDGLATYVEIARRAVDALDQQGNQPWDTFATFMEEIVEADTLALTIKLAGRFRPIPEMLALAAEAFTLNERLVAHTREAGVLRADVEPNDLSFVFEQLSSLRAATPARTAEIRARYLALQLDALRAPGRTPLPGPPPADAEMHARWESSSRRRR
jgi:AcrR family transcriptional regulator